MAGRGEAEGCCAGCAKWLLIIFNVLFCLLGIGLIAAGAYAHIELKDYLDILGSNVNAPAIVLIVFGCVTFIIAAIGCIGACKESSCLLFTFAVIIGILLVAEIVVGIVAFVYQAEVDDWFDEYAPILMMEYEEKSDTANKDGWDFIQEELECCGISGSKDWENTTLAPKQNAKVPESCEPNAADKPGCKDAVVDFAVENIAIIGGVAIGFGVIELLGIVFACCVGCNVKRGAMA